MICKRGGACILSGSAGGAEESMKNLFIAMILASTLASPVAMAEGSYGGLSYGQINFSKDIDLDTGNIGIVLGNINASGFGFEFFYSISVIDDSDTSGGVEITADTDIVSLFAVYQTPGDIYLKGKLGYSMVSLQFAASDLGGAITDTAQDFSYGVAAGAMIGDGALELTYFRFPDFEEFDSIPLDSEVEMINLTYLWTF
jgi:hypothetical protein